MSTLNAISMGLVLGVLAPAPASHVPFAPGAPTNELVSALIKTLKDPDGKVRIHAAAALCNLDSEAVPALLKLIEGTDNVLRPQAARILGSMGTHGRRHPAALPALSRALHEKDAELRRWSSYAISQIVTSDPALALGKDLVPGLIKALSDSEEKVRAYAAHALCTLDMHAVPSLIENLNAKDDAVRAQAAKILGSMGTHGRRHVVALPALTKALQDKAAEVRRWAAHAISQITVANQAPSL
jgi:HEAT repeat protein